MADELERFASLFRNEEQVREELYNLLTKMPRIRDVEITHGSQEYGKDIVFYSESGFDEWVLNACVVKNDKISGSADSNAGARNVFQQVEQALDTPYINREGKDEPVARVYVISTWDSPQTTMSSIQGKLKSRSGQVSFLCGAFLREKFSRFWPEFLLFDSTMLGSYVSKLQHQIDEADPTVFLMAEHQLISSSARKFTEIYVRPHFQLMFKQVALRVQMPFLEALKKNVTRPFVEDFANKLNFAAGFLSEPQVWEHGDPVAAPYIADSFRILARRLPPTWHPQYTQTPRALTP